MEVTTLCYLERDGRYLMLHRVKKKNDINEGKWIAPGGHCEKGESPEDCAIREVREETGIELRSVKFRGIVTFITLTTAGDVNTGNKEDFDITEYMCLFTSDDFDDKASGSGEVASVDGDNSDNGSAVLADCDEGVLEWISKDDLFKLNLWEGDRIFLDLIRNPDQPFFSLKLTYQGDELKEAVLDGRVLSGISLEKVTRDNIEEVWKMQVKAFSGLLEKYRDYDLSPASESFDKVLARFEQPWTTYYFIKSGDNRVGAVRVIDKKDGSRKRISPIWIMEEYRNKGYAQQAMEEVEKIYGSDHWCLDTILQEKGNLHLYEKMGYHRIGETENINERMDIVFYEKD